MIREAEPLRQEPPFGIVGVVEVQPLPDGVMSLLEIGYRYSGEWVAAQLLPISQFERTVYQAPDYTPSSQVREPHQGVVLAHTKDENTLLTGLTRENAPIKIFKAEDANLTESERDLAVAGYLSFALPHLPKRTRELLRTTFSTQNLPGGINEYEVAMKQISEIIEPHMDWANEILRDPEGYWGETYPKNDTDFTRRDWQLYRQRRGKVEPAAQVAAIAGYPMGLRFLGAELVVEHLNPKMSIAHLLGNLTNEQVGKRVTGFPPKDMVIDWAEKIRDNQVVYPPKLERLLGVYKELAKGFGKV